MKLDNKGNYCVGGYQINPAKIIYDRECIKTGGTDGDWDPRGCLKTYRYVKVFSGNVLQGTTYHW